MSLVVQLPEVLRVHCVLLRKEPDMLYGSSLQPSWFLFSISLCGLVYAAALAEVMNCFQKGPRPGGNTKHGHQGHEQGN